MELAKEVALLRKTAASKDWRYVLQLGGYQKRSPQGSVLRPLFFNISFNDFHHVKYTKVNINAYADEHHIYSSNLDPLALEKCICQEVNVANEWYLNNGMIVNEAKHQAKILEDRILRILGKTEHNFCFPVKNSIDLFWVTLDNKLSSENCISVIYKKINNQFNVMIRFQKCVKKETLLKLYKSFTLPHFFTVLRFGISVVCAIPTK